MARRFADASRNVHRTIDGNAVALTFDDGPDVRWTSAVLDVLGASGVCGTFFCVGRSAIAHPALLRRIRAEGHAIGCHSFAHHDPRSTSQRLLARDDLRGCRAINEVLGAPVRLFRPPHGQSTTSRALLARVRGLESWLWTVDPEDWRPGVTAGHIIDVAGAARAGDVVLFHDAVEDPWAPEATDRSALVAALPEIIARIRARGLELVTLPQ